MGALFRPIGAGKLSEAVVDQVRVLIYEGRLKPGDRLPAERELAATFRISRAAVREALERLKATGFIVTRKGGSFVCPLTPATLAKPLEEMLGSEFARIAQFMEMRKSIEAVAAAEAAQKATAKDLGKLQGALRELLEAIQTGRLLRDGGLAFHRAIVEAAHNPSLLHVFQTCATLMRSTWGISNLTRDAATARERYGDHEAIYRAIRARDPVQAREAMLSHLDAAKRTVNSLNPLRQPHPPGRA